MSGFLHENLNFVSLNDYLSDPKTGYSLYRTQKATTVNVLLLGRSQSGKSALLETLINPQQAAPPSRGFSSTRAPQVQSFVLHDENNNTHFNINVIDPPGLCEVRIGDMASRGDEDIMKLVWQCISTQVTCLNIVIYVSVARRTHELDIEAFQCVKNFLGSDFSESSLLVLSRSEEISVRRFQQILDDMKAFSETRELIEYCRLGVLPYGAVSAEKLQMFEDSDDEEDVLISEERKRLFVQRTLKRTEEMRHDLILKIIETANKPVSISLLEGYIHYVKMQEPNAIKKALDWSIGNKEWDRRQYNKYIEELKKHTNELEDACEKKIEIERRSRSAECAILADELQKIRKALLYAEQQAREVKEREMKKQTRYARYRKKAHVCRA